MTENCRLIFYASDDCESFYTAKSPSGHWRSAFYRDAQGHGQCANVWYYDEAVE
jgi:hypothetical protein